MELEEQEIALEIIMENYKEPQNFGKLKDHTFFKHQKNQHCGDVFDLYVKLDENNNIINVKFEGEGCAISTASFSLLTQKLKGLNIEEAKKLTNKDIYEMLKIPISPSRINCAMLSLNALHNGIKHYQIIQNKKNPNERK